MSQIAEKSGIEKASLYYFFKNKEELFGEVIEQIWSELAEEAKQEPALAGNISKKDLTKYFVKVLKTNLEAGFTVLNFNPSSRSTGGCAKAEEHVLFLRKRLRDFLILKKIKEVDLMEALIVNSIQGFVIQTQLKRSKIRPEAYGTFLANLLYKE